MEVIEHRPKGWYGQEVKRLSEEYVNIQNQIAEFERLVGQLPEFAQMVAHPLIQDWPAYYQRQRQMEQTMNVVSAGVQNLTRRMEALEGAVRSLQGRK